MEIQNGNGSSRGGGGEINRIEVRLAEFCKNCSSLDEKIVEQAVKVLKETKHLLPTNLAALGGGSLEEAERYWFACICFVAKRLEEKSKDDQGPSSNEKGLNLCQIMRLANLNMEDFLKEQLTQFIVKSGPILNRRYGPEWENNLEAKELQANFDHLINLSRYYKRVYKELFLTHAANERQSAVASQAAPPLDYHHFGWLLFLGLRIHAFSHLKDLVTCMNGLISIMAILILHMPVRFRSFSLNDSQWFVKRGDKGIDLLASLCNKYDSSEGELKKTMEMTNNLIAGILKKKLQPAAECNSENLLGIDTDGLAYYEDLADESSFKTSLSAFEKDYEDAIRMSELDERIFIYEEGSILGSKSPSGVSVNITGTKRKLDMVMTPTKTITSPLSPDQSPMPHTNDGFIGSHCKFTSTPGTSAMTTSKWLRSIIYPHLSRPSARLELFLASCDKDVTDEVKRRAEIILEAIFPSSPFGERYVTGNSESTNLMDNIWAEQRKKEALKLYYRVLEAMCVAESQILHATNLTSLLTNERFHRCMLACSAILVLVTHGTATMLFPAVLEKTGITAFDLSKVIESFIRHEESLPRELRRHLNSLEERLLESMVWERGSSMYNSLIVARPSLSAEIHRLALLAEPMPSLDSIATHINYSAGGLSPLPYAERHDNAPGQSGDISSPKRQPAANWSVLVERNPFTSPVKDRNLALNSLKSKLPPPALQSAFASPTRPTPGGGGETCAETGISVFFRKINKLAAVRINGMIERLQPSQQHIRENSYRLFQQILSHQTSLFFNRHIDQIILCCLYGIAKISKVNLTFKEIKNNYQKQSNPQVFRCVFVDWSSANQYSRTGQGHLDIIEFYNDVFVPTAKPLLVEVSPAGISTVPEVSNNKDGPCPASPASSSPFPSIPDMSPKKVSAGHNIYVSPLRTSKIDTLISQGSKSYYACVGESTQALQSPSKDLTDINNRLSSGRKIRGALNFNGPDVGLVSDSMVAKSLYQQNGSCRSSSDTAMKSEQPDS